MSEAPPTSEYKHISDQTDLMTIHHALSHDLEAPVRGIKSLGRMLTGKHATQLSEDARSLINLMDAEADRIAQMLSALQAWTHCGAKPTQRAWQDTSEIVRLAVANVVLANPGRNIECDIDALPRIWADRASLMTIFRELLSNAVKFSGKQAAQVISINGRDEGSEVIVNVRDNGVGFDMAYSSQLFGLFRRLHRRQDFAGEGAGLAIARRLIQLHQGRIWVEAAVDQGAVFHFALPKPRDDGNGIARTQDT